MDGARRALIVTTAGALAMLAGFLLLGQAVGTTNITAILATPGLTELPIYPVVLALILLGAFTKSAQWPFHFWLPGAMAAPTPASAYLHSATMVKAGIFLLARLQAGLGHDPLWFWSLFIVGGITMLVGGVSALRYRDMKALLAYATVSVLGILVFMLAFPEPIAVTAVVVTVLAHALYKAPLFLTAGIVDHAMGTRDLRHLAGLARILPLVALTAALGALAMAGVPPTFGFLSKELVLETMADVVGHGQTAGIVGFLGYGAVVVTAVFLGGAAFTLVWEAFFRRRADEEPAHLHHKPAFWFVAPALLLTVIGALAPLFLDLFQGILIVPAVSSILGEPVTKTVKLWHGWTPVFITSLAILVLSVALVLVRTPVRRAYGALPARLSGVLAYDGVVDAVYRFAYEVTKLVQGSTLPSQISITLLAGFVVAVYALLQGNWLPSLMLDSTEIPGLLRVADHAAGHHRRTGDRPRPLAAERHHQPGRRRRRGDTLLHRLQRAGPGPDATAHRGADGHPAGARLLPREAGPAAARRPAQALSHRGGYGAGRLRLCGGDRHPLRAGRRPASALTSLPTRPPSAAARTWSTSSWWTFAATTPWARSRCSGWRRSAAMRCCAARSSMRCADA